MRVEAMGHEGWEAEAPVSAACWLADDAVFRRTAKGQQELVTDTHQLDAQERRILSAVTGYTPLRVLFDLGVPTIGAASSIARLRELGMIELAPDSAA